MKTTESPRPASPEPQASLGRVRLTSSKIRDAHLDKLSIVYVRQSSGQQVLENRESTARQYAGGLRSGTGLVGRARDRHRRGSRTERREPTTVRGTSGSWIVRGELSGLELRSGGSTAEQRGSTAPHHSVESCRGRLPPRPGPFAALRRVGQMVSVRTFGSGSAHDMSAQS